MSLELLCDLLQVPTEDSNSTVYIGFGDHGAKGSEGMQSSCNAG